MTDTGLMIGATMPLISTTGLEAISTSTFT